MDDRQRDGLSECRKLAFILGVVDISIEGGDISNFVLSLFRSPVVACLGCFLYTFLL